MERYKKLLLSNRAWVAGRLEVNQDFFASMARAQSPDYLWIGCSDSRVPSEEITGAEPGELFVHRNVANLVIDSDYNAQSVIQYAIEVLKVKHVIVCGHYGCGGVKASMTDQTFGHIDQWLSHVKDIYRKNQTELHAITDDQARVNRLVELNVLQQVENISRTSFIQKSWAEQSSPIIHGWIYELNTGLLKNLCTLKPHG